MNKNRILKVKEGKTPHINLPNLEISYHTGSLNDNGEYLLEFWDVTTPWHSRMGEKNTMVREIEICDEIIKELKRTNNPKDKKIKEEIESLSETKKFYNKYKNRRIYLKEEEINKNYDVVKDIYADKYHKDLDRDVNVHVHYENNRISKVTDGYGNDMEEFFFKEINFKQVTNTKHIQILMNNIKNFFKKFVF